MGPRKGSKKQPPARGGGGGKEVLGSPGDSDAENGEYSQQTEQEKRKVIEVDEAVGSGPAFFYDLSFF